MPEFPLGLGYRLRSAFGFEPFRLLFGEALFCDGFGVFPHLLLLFDFLEPLPFGVAAQLGVAHFFPEPQRDFVHQV